LPRWRSCGCPPCRYCSHQLVARAVLFGALVTVTLLPLVYGDGRTAVAATAVTVGWLVALTLRIWCIPERHWWLAWAAGAAVAALVGTGVVLAW
jgi:hypothetical protein